MISAVVKNWLLENHFPNSGITFRTAWTKFALKVFVSSESLKLSQITGCSSVVMYSATSEVFPYPAGATTKVIPA